MNVFRIFNVLYVLSDIYILFRGLVLYVCFWSFLGNLLLLIVSRVKFGYKKWFKIICGNG